MEAFRLLRTRFELVAERKLRPWPGDCSRMTDHNTRYGIASVICPTCQYSERPGFVIAAADATRFMPCPTCDGSRLASCCDGAVPCEEDVIDQCTAVDET